MFLNFLGDKRDYVLKFLAVLMTCPNVSPIGSPITIIDLIIK